MDIKKLSERLEAIEHRARTMERRLRWWRILACGLVVVGLVILPLVGGTAQEQSSYERAMARRLAALEYKLQYITGGPNEVVITGANLRIVNGLGDTETTNGLGNLIVGYNELRMEIPGCAGNPDPFCKDARTGSHNIVVGEGNNFSSFGGLVVGFFNEISGEFASVSGGESNTASGFFSSVSGGNNNTASGNFSSVSGGESKTASGDFASSVSGGGGNTASGNFSSVSGGQFNTASADRSSVSGGFNNTASGLFSSVSGGSGNTASGEDSSVSGGFRNTASGDESSVSGGSNRTAPGQFNWAAGPLFAAQ
jgi:trimeric autotransporter adhesin